MIFSIIMATAAINILLAVVALAKGRNRLNMSFFVISILFAAWNACIVLWKGYNIELFSRVNYLFVNLIPPAAVFLVMALYKLPLRSTAGKILAAIAAVALLNEIFTGMTFISAGILELYYTYAVKVYLFVYEFISLTASLWILFYYYKFIKFRQEKLKIGYVIAGFAVLFVGGMLDFSEGLGWHPLKYYGNLANTLYLLIIFYSVFRLRLLDAGFLFRTFSIYLVISAFSGSLYTALYFIFAGEPKVLIAGFFVLSIITVFYSKYFYKKLASLADILASESSMTEARNSLKYIKEMSTDPDNKIQNLLSLLRERFEMEVCVYLREGSDFKPVYRTDDGIFADKTDTMPGSGIILRYESEGGNKILDEFMADIIVPMKGHKEIFGVLAGKKQTADISFLREELDLIEELTAAVGMYIKDRIHK